MGIFSGRNVGVAMQAGSRGLLTYLQQKQQNDLADEQERRALLKAQQDEIASRRAEEKAQRDEQHQMLVDENLRSGMENTTRDDFRVGLDDLRASVDSATPETQGDLRDQAARFKARWGDIPDFDALAQGYTPEDIDTRFGGGIRRKRGLADALGESASISQDNSFAAPEGEAHTPAGSLMQRLSGVQGGIESQALDVSKLLDKQANAEAKMIPSWRQLGYNKKDDFIAKEVLPDLSMLEKYAPPGMDMVTLMQNPEKFARTADLMRQTIVKQTGDTEAAQAAFELAFKNYDLFRKAYMDEQADNDSRREIMDGVFKDVSKSFLNSFGGKVDLSTGMMSFGSEANGKAYNEAILAIPNVMDTLEKQGVDPHDMTSPMVYMATMADLRKNLTPEQIASETRDNAADFPSDYHMSPVAIDFLKLQGLGNGEYEYDKDTKNITVAVPGAGFVHTYTPEQQATVNKWDGMLLNHKDSKQSPKKILEKIKENQQTQATLAAPSGQELMTMVQNSEPPAPELPQGPGRESFRETVDRYQGVADDYGNTAATIEYGKDVARAPWELAKAGFGATEKLGQGIWDLGGKGLGAAGGIAGSAFGAMGNSGLGRYLLGKPPAPSAPQIDKDTAGPPMTADENRRRGMEAYQNPAMSPGFGANLFDGMIDSKGTSR